MAVTSDGDGSAEWGELCDDDGFVYRRRRQAGGQASAASDVVGEVPESTEEREVEFRRRRRGKTLSCMRGLREKYRRELEEWERLASTANQLSRQVIQRPGVELKSRNVDASQSMKQMEDLGRDCAVDELLIQVDCQEAIFRKVEEICSDVDALCEEKEEKLANMLIELPIWSSPRTLLKSLSG
ncbi:Cryptic loci regulator [Rhynchospora pubera]|uniref:Cryptic loci regulator n=1 Tax=Rhynchospora pubera TaxID=906938 RepID=A0AAV8CKP3_9POAL|nr:Cryptic loci regulator [Rhynchospora pubera]